MFEWLKNGNNLGALGMLVGGLGSAYAGYNQSKYAKKLLDLQTQDYYRQLDDRDKRQKSYETAFNNSTLAQDPGLVKLQ